eukprot:TRINITY_DN22222_c0_g1_i2.p1 TRINITY_DN22222_c0_g1~~TRINITY_DN22222_c0_g1_i2.p1  ORF type:complete len:435 (+),score=129.74 TRINITY_DN22222_c0_g1_i2:52-1305(+)
MPAISRSSTMRARSGADAPVPPAASPVKTDAEAAARPRDPFPESVRRLTEQEWDRGPQRVSLVCQVVVTVIMSAAALRWLQPVVMPLLMSILISYALSPLLEFFVHRIGLPHTAAVVIATGFGLSVLGGFILVISLSVGDLTRDADQYTAYANAFHGRVLNATESAVEMVPAMAGLLQVQHLEQTLAELNLSSILARATHVVLQTLLELLSNALLVGIFTVYLLEGRRHNLRFNAASGGVLVRVEAKIREYLRLKMAVSLANGVLAGSVYTALAVPLAPTFGVLHFFLNLIPTVGPLVATLIPIPVVLVVRPSALLLALILPAGAHLVIGYVIEPTVFKGVELHPISMLLSLIFWGMLWGVPGMFFAVPITVACKIGFENVEVTKPFADLLEGYVDDPCSPRSPVRRQPPGGIWTGR